MIGQNYQTKAGYYIAGGITPGPFGQIRRNIFGKGYRVAPSRFPYPLWILGIIALFALGLSAYSLHVLDTVKNQVLTERMVVLERFDESEATFRRVGAILNFLVAERVPTEKSLLEDGLEKISKDLPLTVVTSEKTAIKKSPEERAQILMVLTKSSKLVVAGRNGNWLEVIAPTGERGWVSEKELVAGEAVSG